MHHLITTEIVLFLLLITHFQLFNLLNLKQFSCRDSFVPIHAQYLMVNICTQTTIVFRMFQRSNYKFGFRNTYTKNYPRLSLCPFLVIRHHPPKSLSCYEVDQHIKIHSNMCVRAHLLKTDYRYFCSSTPLENYSSIQKDS